MMKTAEIKARYADIPELGTMGGLGAALRASDTLEMADTHVALKACQIVQTRHVGPGRLATPEQRDWASRIWSDGEPNRPDWTYPVRGD